MNIEQRLKRLEEAVSQKGALKEKKEYTSKKEISSDLYICIDLLEGYKYKLDTHSESPDPRNLKDVYNTLKSMYEDIGIMKLDGSY